MKTLVPVEREAELQIKIREALASRFREFPLFVTLGLWVCILPLILVVVGWIWGFWEALIASLIILSVMITVCLAFCLRVKVGLRKLSDLSAQRAKGNVRR
jgi:hypothetical protein